MKEMKKRKMVRLVVKTIRAVMMIVVTPKKAIAIAMKRVRVTEKKKKNKKRAKK